MCRKPSRTGHASQKYDIPVQLYWLSITLLLQRFMTESTIALETNPHKWVGNARTNGDTRCSFFSTRTQTNKFRLTFLVVVVASVVCCFSSRSSYLSCRGDKCFGTCCFSSRTNTCFARGVPTNLPSRGQSCRAFATRWVSIAPRPSSTCRPHRVGSKTQRDCNGILC